MRSFFLQKNSVLLLLGIIVIVCASLVYLFTSSSIPATQSQKAVPSATVPTALGTELSQQRPAGTCNSKERNFQTGVAFPDWGTTAYGQSDTKWLAELQDIRAQTAACWVEIPILLHQDSLSSTTVVQGPATTSLASFTYGIHFAQSLGFHIFVTTQLQSSGPQPWSGAIKFASVVQTQQWFQSYWQTLKPYLAVAAQAGVEQFALGTEYEWLEANAPASLWNDLITKARNVFPRALTYDMNWGSLQTPPPSWMHNADLKMIGVSAYVPLESTPGRVDPKQIAALWKKMVLPELDNFASALGKPIFASEIGYPNSVNALYQPWASTSTAPKDPVEQAAACDAALANIIHDPHILGSFFWGWDNVGDFTLNGVQATTVIHSYYKSLQA